MSYTGTKVKIPLGEMGLMTDVAPDKVPASALIRANNICFFNGTVQKAPGSIRWNATPLTAGIVAVKYYQPTLEQPFFMAATSDGKIYRGTSRQFNAAIATVSSTPLNTNCIFVTGGAESAGNAKKLFFFTGGATKPYVLSGAGTSMTTISAPASDWTSTGTYPKFGVIHRNRLWAFAGQNAYASSTSNHEDFQNVTTTLTEAIYPGEGGELRAAFVYKGRLFAFKDGGFSYMLNDADTSTTNWYWKKVASNFGIAAPNAVAEVLDDMIMGNTYGTLTSYSASQKLGDVEAADVIQEMQFESYLRSNTSKVGVPFEHLLYYGEKKMLFATYRSSYYTYNDMLLMIDFARKQGARGAIWKKGSPQCLGLYKDINQIDRPMYGDKDGYLNLMDWEDRTEGGSAYTGEFQTAHLDFSFADQGLASAEKHFDFLSVHYVPESTGNLSCDYYIDGRYIETLTFPMTQYSRPRLGTAATDTAAFTLGTSRLAQPNTETVTRGLSGTGRTFSAYFYNSGSNESFQIPAITVYFRAGGDKAQETSEVPT